MLKTLALHRKNQNKIEEDMKNHKDVVKLS